MSRISKVMLKQLPEMHMLSKRKTIDFFKEYADFMERVVCDINSLLSDKDTFPSSGPIVCFHNIELEALDVEIGFEVAHEIVPQGQLKYSVLPSRTVAITIDRGPYEQQDPTLEAMMKWIDENGYQAAGGICYHYLNDEEQPQSEYLTEMYIPVSKK